MVPAPPLEVTVQEAQRQIAEAAAGLRLIDCRDPDEFTFNRLPLAELIPLQTIPAEAAAKLPDKAAPILVYCHHGMRSLRAARCLRDLGYANAQSMTGGIDAWSREIDTSVPRY